MFKKFITVLLGLMLSTSFICPLNIGECRYQIASIFHNDVLCGNDSYIRLLVWQYTAETFPHPFVCGGVVK